MGNFYTTSVKSTNNIKQTLMEDNHLDENYDSTLDYMKNVPPSVLCFPDSCSFCICIYEENRVIYKDKNKTEGWIVCPECANRPQVLHAIKHFSEKK